MENLTSFFHTNYLLTSLEPHIFGCVSFVHNHDPAKGKLDPRSLKCMFVGYSTTQKGYHRYHPSTQKLFTTTKLSSISINLL